MHINIMAVYTKTGDKGETSLFGGSRTGKDSLRVWCYGTIDEVNSALGFLRANLKWDDLKALIYKIQKSLFVVGAQLASDGEGAKKLTKVITQEDVSFLEKVIDSYIAEYGEFKDFVTPGDSSVSAMFHVARATTRRAERHIYTLSKDEDICPILLKYINRLSDALFCLAQQCVYLETIAKVKEEVMKTMENILWEEMAKAAFAEANRLNVKVSIAIADIGGNLLYFNRQRDAILASVNIAINKAYTSAAMKMDTAKVGELSKVDSPLFGINTVDPKMVIFGGGLPLKKNGEICGGIGISGASVEDDIRIAQKAVEVFES